jgi:hypothetical protein
MCNAPRHAFCWFPSHEVVSKQAGSADPIF